MKRPTLPTFILLPAGLLASILAVSSLAASSLAASSLAEPERHTRHGPEFPISIEEAEAAGATRRAEMFGISDANSDGYVTLDEFLAADLPGPHHGRTGHGGRHQRGGANDSAGDAHRSDLHDEIFALMDSDGNGELSNEEFSMEKQQAARAQVMKTHMFTRLDRNGDEVLTLEELPDPVQRLRQADANGDGEVTRDEMRTAGRSRDRGV